MMKASDCKCVVCGKKADVFFGMADPDATQEPYCRGCCDKATERIYKMCLEDSE